jgi:peptidyl-prolyl cis-trans isomerase SurA
MHATRLGVLGLLVSGLAACRGAAPPLPPVPADSGGVLVRAGEPPPVRDGQAVIDRVVAAVNNEPIMMSELQESMILYKRETQSAPEGAELERLVLNRLIDHRLQVQEARREKIEVTDEDMRTIIEDFIRRNGGDRGKIEQQLRAQGVTWEALRRELREQLLAQRVRSRRVVRRATVTEDEVSAYLAENRERFASGLKYRARHLAVTADPPTSEAAWARAKQEVDEIVAALATGADFAELARTRSRDGTAAAGGDLGWLARGELDPTFEKPLLALEKGQVTAPIRSQAGFHLLKLEDREEMTPERLAEARQQVRDLLLQKKAQERFDEWLDGLRRRALISVRL